MENELAMSVKPMRFKNPPIVEAVIAFQVPLLPESAIEDFQAGADTMLAKGYKQPEPVTKHELQIKFEGATSSFDGKGFPHGLKYSREDGLYVVQFNRDGFVFSRLGRYESWESFRDECRNIWDVFAAITGALDIISYGVRYINKLYIPLGQDSEEYVSIYPHLPEGIPTQIQECFMRLGLPILKPRGKLLHQQILLPPDREGFSSLLLDNDFQFPALGLTTPEVWEQLETVRFVKDDYFRKFVTLKMQETFDV
jgi:uncharacterized protein (TIGR04255 family)